MIALGSPTNITLPTKITLTQVRWNSVPQDSINLQKRAKKAYFLFQVNVVVDKALLVTPTPVIRILFQSVIAIGFFVQV